MIKTNALYANYMMINKSIMATSEVVAIVAVLGAMATIAASINNNDAFALDTACPLGHQCHCIAATGVYYDFDPGTGRIFSINTGCMEDNR
jgi:hypothetical protein